MNTISLDEYLSLYEYHKLDEYHMVRWIPEGYMNTRRLEEYHNVR